MKMESSRHGDHVCFFIIGKIIMKGAHSVESFFSCQKELVFQHITFPKSRFPCLITVSSFSTICVERRGNQIGFNRKVKQKLD